jgi:hypothetical protein
LNVEAQTLTLLHERTAAVEKEVAREAEQQKQQTTHDQHDAEEAE